MKKRNMFFLVLALLFIFVGRISGMEESDGLLEPQGTEVGSLTYYGANAGLSSSGSQNSFFGADAGRYNTKSGNTFAGYYAGRSNQGDDVCFFGYYSGYINEGINNSFYGASSGNRNTTGHDNTFIGRLSGRSNVGGDDNTFVGSYAGYANTGNWNTFVGKGAGGGTTTALSGSSNVFVGQNTGLKNTTGASNTFLGRNAGATSATGYYNTFVGRAAGYENITGDYNVFIGCYAGYNETGSNRLYIQSSSSGGASTNPLIYGEFDNRFVRINGNFTATGVSGASDRRWKKEIEPLESPLKKVSEIHGVRYRWKVNEFPDRGLTDDRQIGLIAQDVERVLPELVSEDKDGYKAVSYTKLTAVLVEAVKELKAQNERQQAQIERLQELIKDSKI